MDKADVIVQQIEGIKRSFDAMRRALQRWATQMSAFSRSMRASKASMEGKHELARTIRMEPGKRIVQRLMYEERQWLGETCDAEAWLCCCAKDKDHSDEVHECVCGGQWSGAFAEVDFVMHNMPGDVPDWYLPGYLADGRVDMKGLR